MGPEAKLYQYFKKQTPNISYTRIENTTNLGTPDVLAYNKKGTFFTIEFKVTKRNKVALSPHQVAWHMNHPTSTFVLVHYIYKKNKKNFNEYRLYPGSRIEELFRLGMNLKPLVLGSLEDCACHLLQLEPVPVV